VNAFLICCAIGFVITALESVVGTRGRPTLLRSLQERHYGGIVFFFVATSLTWGLSLWLMYHAGKWLIALVT